jgi:hypothetical protein
MRFLITDMWAACGFQKAYRHTRKLLRKPYTNIGPMPNQNIFLPCLFASTLIDVPV